jgi:hypothetical protein
MDNPYDDSMREQILALKCGNELVATLYSKLVHLEIRRHRCRIPTAKPRSPGRRLHLEVDGPAVVFPSVVFWFKSSLIVRGGNS